MLIEIILDSIRKVREYEASSVTLIKGEFGNDEYTIKIFKDNNSNIKVKRY